MNLKTSHNTNPNFDAITPQRGLSVVNLRDVRPGIFHLSEEVTFPTDMIGQNYWIYVSLLLPRLRGG
jgi:hypothetical protein